MVDASEWGWLLLEISKTTSQTLKRHPTSTQKREREREREREWKSLTYSLKNLVREL